MESTVRGSGPFQILRDSPLKIKLWLCFSGLFVFISGTLILFSRIRMSDALFAAARSEGIAMARNIASLSGQSLITFNYFDLNRIASSATGTDVLFVAIYGQNDDVLAESENRATYIGDEPIDKLIGDAQKGLTQPMVLARRTGGPNQSHDFLDILVPVYAQNSAALWGHVRIGYSMAKPNREVRSTGFILLAFSFGILLLGSLLTFILARRITQPLVNLLKATVRVAQGQSATRIRVHSRDEVGTLAHKFNMMIDRVEAKHQQLLLQVQAQARSRRQLSVILRTIADGIIVSDRSLNLVLMNPAASRLLGLPSIEPGDDRAPIRLADSRLAPLLQATLQPPHATLTRDVEFEPGSGEIGRTIFVHTRALFDSTGEEARGVVATLQDVTQLRAAERAKNELIANVSHELRTPLAVIKISSANIKRYPNIAPEKREGLFGTIERECVRLEVMISDLLDMSRIDAGFLRLKQEIVDLRDLATDVASSLHSRADDKGLTLCSDIHPKPATVRGDRNRLRQVLTNLVVNAINYTNQGAVEVQVRCAMQPDEVIRPQHGDPTIRLLEPPIVQVVVSDSGVGIATKNLSSIFDRFFRGDSEAMEVPGSGLGLAIVKEIVEAHLGTVFALSDGRSGSRFVVQIPLTIVNHTSPIGSDDFPLDAEPFTELESC